MGEYNMPPLGLFGKRCRIKHVSNVKEGFVYRIVNDGIRSNYWADIPLGHFKSKPITHNTGEDIVIVVCDTLIDEHSKLERVRLKDIEIMNEPEPILGKIRAEIDEEADYAYADFDRYKEDILHAESDELPDDDFRYGLRRAIEIIDKYKESEG